MEKVIIRPCDKEYMRMAMLKHEETFKEQVYELHRLYRIQKILMRNMEANRGMELHHQGWNFKTQNGQQKGAQRNPKMNFDLERPAMEGIAESESDEVLEIINESEIELTLGPSSYNRKKIETPKTSDSGHSISSSSSGSSLINNTRFKTQNGTREEFRGGIIGLVSGCHGGTRNRYDIEEKSRLERSTHPPWLFQALSLNTT